MTCRLLVVLAAALLFLPGFETLTFAESPPVRTLTPQQQKVLPQQLTVPKAIEQQKVLPQQLTVPKAIEVPITVPKAIEVPKAKTLPTTVTTGELTMTGTAIPLPTTVTTGELTMTGVGN